MVNEKAEEKVRRMEEGDRTESDHVPLEVELEEREISIKSIKQERTKIKKKKEGIDRKKVIELVRRGNNGVPWEVRRMDVQS